MTHRPPPWIVQTQARFPLKRQLLLPLLLRRLALLLLLAPVPPSIKARGQHARAYYLALSGVARAFNSPGHRAADPRCPVVCVAGLVGRLCSSSARPLPVLPGPVCGGKKSGERVGVSSIRRDPNERPMSWRVGSPLKKIKGATPNQGPLSVIQNTFCGVRRKDWGRLDKTIRGEGAVASGGWIGRNAAWVLQQTHHTPKQARQFGAAGVSMDRDRAAAARRLEWGLASNPMPWLRPIVPFSPFPFGSSARMHPPHKNTKDRSG